MWDNTLPESEASQRNELEVGKYFQNVTEDGNQYSVCLMSDCGRRLAGGQVGNLRTHLSVAHNIRARPSETECVSLDADTSNDTTASLPLGDTEGSDPMRMKQNLSESADARKYFQIVTENGKIYSKCLVRSCSRLIAGSRLNNLKRHLKCFHDSKPNPSDDDDDDVVDNPESGCAPVPEDSARKYFRFVTVDGKLYSECLIRGCKRRLADNVPSSWKRHLKSHRMEVRAQSNTFNCRRYFQSVTENGKLYSKCLIEGCNHRLSGNHGGNLNRHLIVHHDMTVPMKRQINSTIEKIFQKVEIDGKVFTKCLMKGCHHRIFEHNSENQKRHMHTEHNMNWAYYNKYKVPNRRGRRNTGRNQSQLVGAEGPNSIPTTKNGGSATSQNALGMANERKFSDQVRKVARPIPSSSGKRGRKWPDIAGKTVCLPNGFHPYSLERSEVRKYFQSADDDGIVYSKCLVVSCNYILAGAHLGNMRRHLIRAHNTIERDPHDIQRDSSELCPNESAIVKDVRKYYESVEIDGKLHSRCLVGNCNSHLTGLKLANMRRHLIVIHKMNSPLQPRILQKQAEGEDVRKYFRIFSEYGKLYSECLVNDCKHRQAGNHLSNLKRHLRMRHEMDRETTTICDNISGGTSTDSVGLTDSTAIAITDSAALTDCAAMTASASQLLMDQESDESNTPNTPVNLADRNCVDDAESNVMSSNSAAQLPNTEERLDTNELLGQQNKLDNVRKYFQTVTEDGKIYSKCLMKNCGRRLAGKRGWEMKRHLIRIHYMNSESMSTCRLCFQQKNDAIDIFNGTTHVANIIRLHFPSDEVS